MVNQPSDPQAAGRDKQSKAINNDSHSFVIRIWLEDIGSDDAPMLWRGYIAHVLEHERYHFQDLSDIITFMTPYLAFWEAKHQPTSAQDSQSEQ